MTNYYVRKTGSDAAAGTSKATAWATLGKALGASGIASGDTLYVGAGTYRESVTVTMTSPTAETKVIADVDGAQTGDAGRVVWTAYTTNDSSAPAVGPSVNLNGRDYLTFENFIMVGGNNANGSCIDANTQTSTNIALRKLGLLPGRAGQLITIRNTADVALNWVVDRCVFMPGYWTSVYILATVSATADYDLNVQFLDCLFHNADISVYLDTTGVGTFKPGGVDLLGCTVGCQTSAIYPATANASTSIPCVVQGCLIFGGYNALKATTSGQIAEDNNELYAATPRVNVSAGANSKSDFSHAPLLSIGQEWMHQDAPVPFLMPLEDSPLLGFGNGTGVPAIDWMGLNRPAGGGSTLKAVGALERHESGAKETTTVRTGSTALVIVGPGDHSFDVAVNAVSTTIVVYARYDSTHGSTNKPQMQLFNGGEIGVADATATMTAAADTWEQLALTFTPTTKGIVTIRLISRAAAGGGKAFFDDLARS